MDDIINEQIYPYSPEQVWEALTNPASLAEWLMPAAYLFLEPCLPIQVLDDGCGSGCVLSRGAPSRKEFS